MNENEITKLKTKLEAGMCAAHDLVIGSGLFLIHDSNLLLSLCIIYFK